MSYLENYEKNGYSFGAKVLKDNEIFDLRNKLDKIFLAKGNPKELNLFEIDDQEITKLIYNIYTSQNFKNLIVNLSDFYCQKISLIPHFIIQRNYHVDRKSTPGIGWHRDCGGELAQDYSKNKLTDKNYVFGKIGIYLQQNSDYGGSVDLIPKSHIPIKSYNSFFKKIYSFNLFLLMKIQKYFSGLYLFFSERKVMKILKAKRLFPDPGTIVFWDSRTIHRGTPIDDKLRDKIKFNSKNYQAEVPKEFTKFSLYVDFGTNFAFDSYMHDRNNRASKQKEIEILKKNLHHMRNFSPTFSQEVEKNIEPVLNKYN